MIARSSVVAAGSGKALDAPGAETVQVEGPRVDAKLGIDAGNGAGIQVQRPSVDSELSAIPAAAAGWGKDAEASFAEPIKVEETLQALLRQGDGFMQVQLCHAPNGAPKAQVQNNQKVTVLDARDGHIEVEFGEIRGWAKVGNLVFAQEELDHAKTLKDMERKMAAMVTAHQAAIALKQIEYEQLKDILSAKERQRALELEKMIAAVKVRDLQISDLKQRVAQLEIVEEDKYIKIDTQLA